MLFNSDFFKAENVRYERVKSPAELLAGVLKLTGEFQRPREEMIPTHMQSWFMGQHLLNPPSVEGWHWGTEWIDSGALVERVNFASERMGNLESPGVRDMVDNVLSDGNGSLGPAELVERALDQLSLTAVTDETRASLVEFVERSDDMDGPGSRSPEERAAHALKLAAAAPEFQRA